MPSELLRNLVSKFRYSNCEQFVGQKLVVSGKDAVASDLTRFIAELVPDEGLKLATGNYDLLLGTNAKFGVLDIAFFAPANINHAPIEAGLAIRELGFLSSTDSDIEFDDDPEYCLRELHDCISDDQLYLQLFLTTNDPKITDVHFFERVKRVKNHETIPFPIEFTVVDACVTNSNYAWFNKHNYTLLYMMNSY